MKDTIEPRNEYLVIQFFVLINAIKNSYLTYSLSRELSPFAVVASFLQVSARFGFKGNALHFV